MSEESDEPHNPSYKEFMEFQDKLYDRMDSRMEVHEKKIEEGIAAIVKECNTDRKKVNDLDNRVGVLGARFNILAGVLVAIGTTLAGALIYLCVDVLKFKG
jgi:hypothetical protein